MFVLERDRFQCCICKCKLTNETANIDHIKPWPLGRTNPSNLTAICRTCNKAKSNFVGLVLHPTDGGKRTVAFDRALRHRAGATIAEWVHDGLATTRVDGPLPGKLARKYTPVVEPERPFLPRDCMECRVTQRLCQKHLL